jgi:hypothetical protein
MAFAWHLFSFFVPTVRQPSRNLLFRGSFLLLLKYFPGNPSFLNLLSLKVLAIFFPARLYLDQY